MTRMRDEVVSLCGFPDPPAIGSDHRRALTEEPTPLPGDATSIDRDNLETIASPITQTNEPSASPFADRDPKLAYYLAQAGLNQDRDRGGHS